MNPLASIPPRVRQGLYFAYAIAGIVLAVLAVYGVDVAQHGAALAVVGAAFGFTAGSNVKLGGEHRAEG